MNNTTKFPVADACQVVSATGIFRFTPRPCSAIAHTILNVVVDNEVELFFCKAVMLRQKQGLYVYFIYFFRKIDSLRQDIQYVGIVDDGVEV